MTNDKKPPQTITFTVDNVEFTVSRSEEHTSELQSQD